MIRVTSTARNVGRFAAKRCVRSVIEQSLHEGWTYHFFDAASTDDTLIGANFAWGVFDGDNQEDKRVIVRSEQVATGPLDKLVPLWRSFDDDDIIVWGPDGDDYFATDRVLETVKKYHDCGARVTYGQFILQDGRMGFCGQVGPDPRNEPWRASHLKTFRSGLFKKIDDADLRDADGKYFMTSIDRAVMLPLLEMEPARSVFIPQILYVYSWDVSYEMTEGPQAQSRAAADTSLIHGRPRYSRL